jgi:hypothetical protein
MFLAMIRFLFEVNMVVWSFFDSETASVAKALPEHDVFSFGVGGGCDHVDLDLSDFRFAKNVLDKYPNPDAVFASPPCNTWCFVNVGCKRFFTSEPGINLYWRDKWDSFDFNFDLLSRRINGCNTALFVASAIRHYSPRYWVVENPTRSLLFAFLFDKCGLPGCRNFTNYFSYGFDYWKPTTIYSSKKLFLKNEPVNVFLRKIETHLKGKSNAEASVIRSAVPLGLYKDIMDSFLTPNLFGE